jgi:8-oxo-dGTP diphosphatase
VTVSGDGFVLVADGTQRWGRFGAAGILARWADDDGASWYFLARRSEHCHQGGTWAVPGGALHLGEDPLAGGLREWVEEVGTPLDNFTVVSVHEDDHGGWSYWTVVVEVASRFAPPASANWETTEISWTREDGLPDLNLHDAFRSTLVRLGLLPGPGADEGSVTAFVGDRSTAVGSDRPDTPTDPAPHLRQRSEL